MRGTGSLHALLGRDATKRKYSNKSNSRSATNAASEAGHAAASSSAEAGTAGTGNTISGTFQQRVTPAVPALASGGAELPQPAPAPLPALPRPQQQRPTSPAKAGCVRCPVCNCQLAHDDEKVNAHIDKCLSKGTMQRRTQQASIFQFAVRPAAQQPQQAQQAGPGPGKSSAALAPGRRRSGAAAAALAAGTAAAASAILATAGAAEAAAEAAAGVGFRVWGKAAEAAAEGVEEAAVVVDLTAGNAEEDEKADAVVPAAEPTTTAAGSSRADNHGPAAEALAAAAAAAATAASQHLGQQQQERQQPPAAVQSPSVSWSSQSTLGKPGVQQDQQQQEEVQPQPRQHTPGSKQQHGALTVPARQQQLVRKQRPGAAAQRGSLHSFNCSVVGRRFQRHETTCQSGQRLVVEWEAGNPRDAHALLALDADSRCPLGHLPHVVARHLALLLRSSQVVAEAVVLEEPLSDKAALLVELQVAMQPAAHGASPGAAGRLVAALGRAAAAAATQLQQQPQGTGERLQANFLAVLDTVQQHDLHLLAGLETGFIAAYKALPLPCQCLFLRLFQRKGPLFSITSLAYQDVPDAAEAASQLAAAGLVGVTCSVGSGMEHPAGSLDDATGFGEVAATTAGGPSWRELADLLAVPDLAAVLAARKIRAASPPPGPSAAGGGGGRQGAPPAGLRNRQQLLAALDAHAARSSEAAGQLAGWLLEATGPVLRLAGPACEAVCRLQRLFFLNEGHSLSQFLATDLGGVKYPQYQVHRTCRVFDCRADLLDYEQALRHAAELADALEEGDTEAAEAVLQHAWATLDADMHKQDRPGKEGFLRQFDSGWVYCMMATAGVSLLERQRRYKEAVDRLVVLLGGRCCLARRGEWWVRLSVNLEHLNRPVQALEKAEAALADEWLSSGDRLALQRRVLRLGKPPRRWKRPPWAEAAQREPPEVRIIGRPLNSVIGTKSRFYGLDDEQCSVEELALQHYATPEAGGWQGTHSEGGIWATLFGLLMWDVLFLPIPDVFRTPFQTAPLDLNTAAFYPTRKEAVEACLARVAAGEAPALLRRTWEQHQGTLCRGVSWDRHSLEDLRLVAECIGGSGLAAVCRLLAQDHAGWSGGMPDLLLWHAGRREAKLAEVKGPRDRLSDQQRAWMNALTASGLQAEVLKVVEPAAAGGNGGGKKRRR